MNFFDLLRKIIYFGKKTEVELNTEDLQQFTPFMINRWLSFYDKSKAVFVNETLNRFTGLFDDKRDMFDFYYYLVPKSRFKKIDYIKKKKEKTEKVKDNSIELIARNNMLSQREVQYYIDLQEQLSK